MQRSLSKFITNKAIYFVTCLRTSKHNRTVMSNPNFPPSQPASGKLIPVSKSLLLELGTLSLMGAIVAQKAMSETIISLAQASEEVFRGDRLPILPFPDVNITTDNS